MDPAAANVTSFKVPDVPPPLEQALRYQFSGDHVMLIFYGDWEDKNFGNQEQSMWIMGSTGGDFKYRDPHTKQYISTKLLAFLYLELLPF